ncbi:hypothetical protein ACWCL1_05085 [Ligilactobacillus sp. LYQ135]
MSKNDKELAVELTCSYLNALSALKKPMHPVLNDMNGLNGGGSVFNKISTKNVNDMVDIFYSHLKKMN